MADPKTLPLLNSCLIRKLLTLTFGDSCQKNCNFLNIEHLCCLKNHMETTQSIKVNTLTKAIPLFYLLLLIFLCTVVYLLFLCGTVQLNQGQNFQNESFLIKNLISFCSISIIGSSREEVYHRYLRIAVPEKWIKYLKNNFEGVHFSVHSKLSNIYFYQKQAPSQVFIKDFARIKFFP